jgi:hypothetical protein
MGQDKDVARAPPPATLARKRHYMRGNPFLEQGKAERAFRHSFHYELKGALAADVQIEAVHQEKRVGGGKSHPLVAVQKRMIIDQ